MPFYVLVGAAWISLSDHLAGLLVGDGPAHARLHILLASGFVLASAAVLVSLVRRALDALGKAERVMRATIQSIADPVLLLDLRGQVIDTNPAAVQMFGVSDKRALLRHVHELGDAFHLRYADGRKVPFQQYASDAALQGAVIRRYEAILRRADGSDLFITVSSAPVRERIGGAVELAVTVLHDIDELKRLEKLRDDFLAITAHELKTPLATVKGYAQLLQQPAAPASARGLSIIESQAARMDRLIRDLLDLSRFKGGRLQLHREVQDLASLARDAVERARVLSGKHRIVLEPCAPVSVEADRERIDQVITNLLDNAVKFSPGGGEVRVSVAASADEALLSVQDQGVGIPADRQARIFDQFVQVPSAGIRNPTGMGIGLFLAREIVLLHGGRIWVESAPEKGSRFWIALPRVQRPDARPARPGPHESPPGPRDRA